jgi:K+ transporter
LAAGKRNKGRCRKRRRFFAATDVVSGDIGASLLRTAIVETKSAGPAGQIAPEVVLGIVSLILVADRRHLDQIRGPDHAHCPTG